MKRILLPLSLLLLLALAAGCSAQGEAQLDPTMAQQLQIDETMAATLAPGIQDVDVTDRGTDLTIHVRQTLSLIHTPSPRDLSTSRMPSSA